MVGCLNELAISQRQIIQKIADIPDVHIARDKNAVFTLDRSNSRQNSKIIVFLFRQQNIDNPFAKSRHRSFDLASQRTELVSKISKLFQELYTLH